MQYLEDSPLRTVAEARKTDFVVNYSLTGKAAQILVTPCIDGLSASG